MRGDGLETNGILDDRQDDHPEILALSTRLALCPGVKALVHAPNGVVLVDGRAHHSFEGLIYPRIVSLLDGFPSFAALLSEFSGSAAKSFARLALLHLVEKGLVIASDGALSPKDIFLKHALADAILPRDITVTLTSFVSARSVDGVGLFVEALADLGVKVVEAAADSTDAMALILADDYLDPRIANELVLRPAPALLVCCNGQHALCGPLLTRPAVVWPAFQRRLRGQISGAQGTPWRSIEHLPRAFLMQALGWLAVEVIQALHGSSKGIAADVEIRSFDLAGQTRRSHILIGGRKGSAQTTGAFDDSRVRASDMLRNEFRARPAEQLLPELEALDDPLLGIAPFVQTVHQGAISVCATFHRGGAHQLGRLKGHESYLMAGGKGFSTASAQVSCLGEAVERFCSSFHGDEVVRRSRLDDLEGAIDPRSLLHYSADQYAAAARGDALDGVPRSSERDDVLSWTPCTQLVSGKPHWLPAAFAFLGYRDASEAEVCRADSNGCASGSTVAEATLHGLLELVERDACSIWWYNMLSRTAYDLSSFDDPRIDAVVSSEQARGRRTVVLDISSDIPVSVCAAISAAQDGSHIHIGLGAAFEARSAVLRALAEMVQVGTTDVGTFSRDDILKIGPALADWFQTATLRAHPHLVPQQIKPLDVKPGGVPETIGEALRHLLSSFEERGLSAYVVDMSRERMPLKVVRTVVPGLRHFWRRLGPGRLYDVPVQMGWRDAPRVEALLNPTSYCL